MEVLSHQQARRVMALDNIRASKRKAEEEVAATARKNRRLDLSQDTLDDDDGGVTAQDLLNGVVQVDLSHAGGEFLQILLDDPEYTAQFKTKYKDCRTRRDRVLARNEGFRIQLDAMARSYLEWRKSIESGGLDTADPPPPADVGTGMTVTVVDTFWEGVAAAFVCLGLIPCAPKWPSLVITTRLLELYHKTSARCPSLTIQPFVKSICDVHGLPYRPYLWEQFSFCYDVYLNICDTACALTLAVLGCDTSRWRLKNFCAACTYKLKGEADLIFSMLITMDGNNLLKRLMRKEDDEITDDGPVGVVGGSRERLDDRVVKGDYYLTCAQVDHWTKDRIQEQMQNIVPCSDSEEPNPCAMRWTNMINNMTSRMWSVFDETGIFLALCQHGFVLLVADMIRSGELSKYPLAIIEAVLKTFGENIACGYDIGCKFGTTISLTTLGPMAEKLKFRSVVGAFHGHAHNRLCQLTSLPTYVAGLFHCNNYRQALGILDDKPALLAGMENEKIADRQVFASWLKEEGDYLSKLSKEPEEEKEHLDYYQALVNLQARETELTEVLQEWQVKTSDPSDPEAKRAETLYNNHCRRAQDNVDRAKAVVDRLEESIPILNPWTPSMPEYQKAAERSRACSYRQSLDELEALVVSRIFELTKMNMSQTGYKLRRHIGKALQTQSRGIRRALDKYNLAAHALKPPHPIITYEAIMEYSFLSQFDLLRDTRQDVRDRPWSTPMARYLMDKHFKILRAEEEITRLNIEIRRVITHLHDEECFLCLKENQTQATDPLLAYQIRLYHLERTPYAEIHMRRFKNLASNPRFTGTLLPETAMSDELQIKDGGDIVPTVISTCLSNKKEALESATSTVTQNSDGANTTGSKDSNHDQQHSEGKGATSKRTRMRTRLRIYRNILDKP
ncbi:hypothetical protein NP233_g487 [Leucocoprinus birnbaumii]|uniref:Uncharacterized protein n=1 Tax=Leucocoprinus birnbaumii TaxID=56174 RepID=A0AAD5W3S1_9AGAR|nr:hypothetical protein NP233_g487 [Leucocoprinus birnbaumii]